MRVFVLFVIIQLLGGSFAAAWQADSIVTNGSFETWENGQPVGWEVARGAGRSGKPSKVVAIQKGVELSGDRSTQQWQFLSQDLKVIAGKTYRLEFVARATDIRREAGQFDNCYVAVFTKDRAGKMLGQEIRVVTAEDFEAGSLNFTVQPGTRSSIAIFLSKTGRLAVKDLRITELDPSKSFDILVEDMGRNYSYFDHKKIDWDSITAKYRGRAEDANTAGEFTKVVLEMLGELNDGHVWIEDESGKRVTPKNSKVAPKPNYDIRFVAGQLDDIRQIRRYCLTGRTKDGFGYVLIDSMFQMNDATFKQMCADIHRLFDAPGLIVDCRTNGGGAEPIGQKLAGMFVEERVLYAKQKIRSGPKHNDFTLARARHLSPWRFKTGDKAYTKPIVCLQGPGAMSSGEAFTLMMKAIPHCTNIGQPTRGSSGNPAPVELPNGVEVWYSRWVAMNPDETPFEDVGVQPDIVVEHTSSGDATFSKAIEMLSEKTSE